MAARFLLVLLLVVSGGAASAGDEEVGQPRLEFRGIHDTGRGHGPFAPEEPVSMPDITAHDDEPGEAPRLEFTGIVDSGRGHASDVPEEPVFMARGDHEPGEAPLGTIYHKDLSCPDSGRVHASDAPEEQAFLDVISTGGDKLDGGDELAAACKPSGGDLGWLYTCIPSWAVISMVVAGIAGVHTGLLLQDALNKNNKANLSGY
ncbi:hypothetical protein ZWY2020_009030 [Hordeum vulgare]|nr:hypothetical protein ZWY2020_009030 [Hordeum vulgare]